MDKLVIRKTGKDNDENEPQWFCNGDVSVFSCDEYVEAYEWIKITEDNFPPEHHRVLGLFDDGSIDIVRWVGEKDYWIDNSNLDFDYGSTCPKYYMELPSPISPTKTPDE